MRKRTRLGVVGLAVVAMMAMMAVVAQGASAFTWTNEKGILGNGVSQNIKTAGEVTETLVFTGTISGTPVKITSTGISTEGAKITQVGAVNEISGKLKFTGLTLDEPTGCSPPASVTTTQLAGKSFEKSGATYLELKPTSGTTFATVTLSGTCAIAGTPFKVTTSTYFCGQTNAIGTMAVKQPLKTSAAILTACGGTISAGGNPANLSGNASFELENGESWGAK